MKVEYVVKIINMRKLLFRGKKVWFDLFINMLNWSVVLKFLL